MEREEIQSRLMDLVDGTLPADEARAVEEALARHPDLRREADDLREAIRLASELTPVEAPADLGGGIRDALDRDDGEAAPRTRILPLWFVSTAAAAVLLIAVLLVVDRRAPEEPAAPSRMAADEAPREVLHEDQVGRREAKETQDPRADEKKNADRLGSDALKSEGMEREKAPVEDEESADEALKVPALGAAAPSPEPVATPEKKRSTEPKGRKMATAKAKKKGATGEVWKPAGVRAGGSAKPAASGSRRRARGGDAGDDRLPKGSAGYAKRLRGQTEKEKGSARAPEAKGRQGGFLGDAEPARKSKSAPRPGTPAPATPSAPTGPAAEGARGDKKGERVEPARVSRPVPVRRRNKQAMPTPGRALEVRVGENRRHQAREALLRFLVDRDLDARYVSPSAKKDGRPGFFGRTEERVRKPATRVHILVRLSPDEARGVTTLLGRFGSLDKRYARPGKAGKGTGSGGLRDGDTPRIGRRVARDKKRTPASSVGRAPSGEDAAESKEWILIILRG